MKRLDTPFGISTISLISVRANPDHRSELLTQILFGELFQVLNTWNEWVYILHEATGIEGWIVNQCIAPIADADKINSDIYANLETVYVVNKRDTRHPLAVLPGSSIPVNVELGRSFHIGDQKFHFEAPLPEKLGITNENKMEALAQIFINAPFLWGGRSLFGIDNAGLTQLVYKLYGIKIPGNLNELVKIGQSIPFANDSKPGDIAFFENKEGDIIHSGIITQPGRIIHCHGMVREDPLDHAGIYGVMEEDYLYYLRIIKRILPV